MNEADPGQGSAASFPALLRKGYKELQKGYREPLGGVVFRLDEFFRCLSERRQTASGFGSFIKEDSAPYKVKKGRRATKRAAYLAPREAIGQSRTDDAAPDPDGLGNGKLSGLIPFTELLALLLVVRLVMCAVYSWVEERAQEAAPAFQTFHSLLDYPIHY